MQGFYNKSRGKLSLKGYNVLWRRNHAFLQIFETTLADKLGANSGSDSLASPHYVHPLFYRNKM